MKIGKDFGGRESDAHRGRAAGTAPDPGADARDLARRQMQRERRRHLAKLPEKPDGKNLASS